MNTTGDIPLHVPVFCTLRPRHTPSIHFQERSVRNRRQRFATQNVREKRVCDYSDMMGEKV